jgi:DNA-binding CsgD family transcriptional regulator
MAEDAALGVLLLDDHGGVLVCNDVARGFLRAGDTPILSPAHRESSQFAAALHDCLDADRNRGHEVAMLLDRRQGRFVRCIVRTLHGSSSPPLTLCVFSQSATPPPSARNGDTEIIHVAPESDGKSESPALARLTTSELAILRMIGEGLSTQDMAARLSRSPKTVEWHRASLGRKLHARSRVELARLAITLGIVKPLTDSLPTRPAPAATARI